MAGCVVLRKAEAQVCGAQGRGPFTRGEAQAHSAQSPCVTLPPLKHPFALLSQHPHPRRLSLHFKCDSSWASPMIWTKLDSQVPLRTVHALVASTQWPSPPEKPSICSLSGELFKGFLNVKFSLNTSQEDWIGLATPHASIFCTLLSVVWMPGSCLHACSPACPLGWAMGLVALLSIRPNLTGELRTWAGEAYTVPPPASLRGLNPIPLRCGRCPEWRCVLHHEALPLSPPAVFTKQSVRVGLLWKLVNGLSVLCTEPVTADATAGVTVLTSGLHLPDHRVGMGSQSRTPKAETIKETRAKYGCITLTGSEWLKYHQQS